MNVLNWRRGCMIAVLAVSLLFAPVGTVEGQNPHFTVTLTGQSLTAGFNNNVTIMVTYSYSSKSIYPSNVVYDVDLAVSMPTPLQMVGDSHWHYDSLKLGQSVAITFQVYAPTGAIGSSYQASVTLNYRELGDISYTEETHSPSFSVLGWINLALYGIQITSTAAVPGGNATVSGNLLNSGNLAAYNANVTVESEALALGNPSSLFLGEVDPNIPRPFSLLVSFRKNLAEGNYSIVVHVSAIDTNNPASPYSGQQTTQVQIKKPVVRPTTGTQRTGGGLIGMILEILRYLWGIFSDWSSLPTLSYSYFGATTAFIPAAHQAG